MIPKFNNVVRLLMSVALILAALSAAGTAYGPNGEPTSFCAGFGCRDGPIYAPGPAFLGIAPGSGVVEEKAFAFHSEERVVVEEVPAVREMASPSEPPVQTARPVSLGKSISLPKALGMLAISKGMEAIAPDGELKTTCSDSLDGENRFYRNESTEGVLTMAFQNNARNASTYAARLQDATWELSGWVEYRNRPADLILLAGMVPPDSPTGDADYLVVRLFSIVNGLPVQKNQAYVWLNWNEDGTEMFPSLMPLPDFELGGIVGSGNA